MLRSGRKIVRQYPLSILLSRAANDSARARVQAAFRQEKT